MTIDEAVDLAFRLRSGGPLRNWINAQETGQEVIEQARELISSEVDRLVELTTWEARFACSILEPMVDELYKPQLNNAAIA